MKKTLLSLAFALTAFAGVQAQTVLSQTGGQAPEEGGVACSSSTGMSPAAYYRAYTLNSDFNVGAVQFGIGDLGATTNQFPIIVKLYSGGTFPGSFPNGFTQVAETTATIMADDALSLLQIPITGSFTSGTTVVVEISNVSTLTADGGDGSKHYPGKVASATAPSYLVAPGCGINTPTSFAAINFPNNQIIIDLIEATSGTEDFAQNKIAVYPNPAHDVISISYTDTLDNISITDLNGRVVKQVVAGVSQAQINIADLSQGVYILNASANGKTMTEKIVKK